MTSTLESKNKGKRTEQTLGPLFSSVDISFLVLFRIVLGAAVLWVVWDFFRYDLVGSLATRPFHFTYHGFAWVKPWPTVGMHIHFGLLALFGLFLICGFLYRLATVSLFVGFTYVFLLEKAEYFNHYYLICLFLFLLIFLPANRCFSLDVILRPKIKTDVVPAWTLWLLRFQVGLPYVYGGIAKLNADWLRGQPMQIWMSKGTLRELFGSVFGEYWMALMFSWGGAIFDLSIVPLLLWKRTRRIAFCGAVLFHVLNAIMFEIDVFPWMMIGATLIFFPPDWPRQFFRLGRTAPPTECPITQKEPRKKLIVALLAVYIGFHLLIPFRHLLIPGNPHWTEDGHRFAWRMMLRTKVNAIQFIVTDRATGRSEFAQFFPWLTPRQFNKMARDPEMLREFAHFLREKYREEQRLDVEVRVVALSSLNGRKPQQLVDPEVDLSREPRRWLLQPWVLPLVEPFRNEPWQEPVDKWPQHVTIRWPSTLRTGQ